MFKNFKKIKIIRMFLIESSSRLAVASSIGIFIGILLFDGRIVPLLTILIALIFRLNIISMIFGILLTIVFPLIQLFISWVGQKTVQINMPLIYSTQLNIENVLKVFENSKLNHVIESLLIAFLISMIFFLLFKFLYKSIFFRIQDNHEIKNAVFEDNTGRRRILLKIDMIIFTILLLIIFITYEVNLHINPILMDIRLDKAISISNIKAVSKKDSTMSKDTITNINSFFQINSRGINNYNIEHINETNVFVFYVSWDRKSKTSLEDNIKKIDVAMPNWFYFNEDMTVRSDKQSEIDDILEKNNVKNMPLISNYINGKWDRQLVHELISTQEKRSKHVDDLLLVVKSGKYYGVNIDYEDIDPLYNGAFISFIKELSEKFHSNGYYVSLDLNPAWNKTFNYKELSNYADYIILMFYGESYPTGSTGPVASQEWFKNQLNKVGDIPREKLVTGLGNYGYDWALNGSEPAKTVTFSEAINTAKQGNLIIEWDSEKLNPYYMYKDGSEEHVVWFLDAITLYNQLKYSILKGIPNVALWRLGSEDPVIWDYIDKGNYVGNYINTLEKIEASTSINYEGQGEILRITSLFKNGARKIESNEKGFIVNESYVSYPSEYEITRYGNIGGKKIVLTFDDGPDLKYTPQILDILKEHNVKAIFFVLGKNVAEYPNIIKRMYNEGHEIGSHTFSHPEIFNISDIEVKKELNSTQRIIEAITGHSTLLFRTPYGVNVDKLDIKDINNNEIVRLMNIQNMGYTTIDFNIDSKDWKGISADEIYQRIENELSRGHIVLLHDAGGDRSNTVKALSKIIEGLRSKGYEFVSVSSLIGKTRDDMMPLEHEGDKLLNTLHETAVSISRIFLKFSSTLFFIAIYIGLFRLIFLIYYSNQQNKKRKEYKVDKQFTPFVSVVIAGYNEENVICKTINSILESDYENFDVIFVDDGSEDNTVKLVKETYKSNQKVKVIDKEHGGKPAAINMGFKSSSREIIVSLDADTIISHDAISFLVSYFKDENVAAVSGHIKVGNIHNIITKWQHIEYVIGFNLERRAFSMHNCTTVVPGALGAWRKSVVAECGYFKEDTLAEDTDLTLDILKKGYKIELEERAYAYTESPADLKSLIKQRTRWSYGTLQCLWKHKDMLFRRKYKSLGSIALPNMWLFQYVFQPLSPIADIYFILGLLGNNVYQVTLYYTVFLMFDYIVAIYTFRLEEDNMKVLIHIFLQRIVYRLIMTYIVIKAIISAIGGVQVAWNKLIRIGNVKK